MKTPYSLNRNDYWSLATTCFLLGGWLLWPVPTGQAADIKGDPLSGKFTNYAQKMPGSTVTFGMVAIPGGTIALGAPADEPGRDTNDLPRRTVTIKPFWMGAVRLPGRNTCRLFFTMVGNYYGMNISLKAISTAMASAIRRRPMVRFIEGWVKKGHPALGMGLPAAYEFCRWVTKRTGVHYRLPTEEE